ncbi:RND family transporter [Mycobacterium heckeshornense]|uniref:Putative transport protein MmpL8 n=1 Tax=Mycobacterium heckeshornense TaxID=110505 RepID=A0A7R7GPE6_9MYCO|nr:RND family transporter [Mycobacterium heckeshornense]BCO33664.1 putative transport protein MmpL8 [Mycobacterium heckeshornense]
MLRREPANRRPTVGILLRVARLVVRRPSVVIGLWVVLAAVLSVTFAPLTQVVREHHEEILPSDAPVMVATRQMTESFHETKAENVVLVVLTNEHGLTRADEDVYRTLVDRLRRDTRDVVIVQDFITTPPLREVFASKDNKAWLVPVGIAGDNPSPKFNEAYARVANLVKQTLEQVPRGSDLAVKMAGLPATAVELADIGERDLHLITAATVIMVLLILLLIYRNPVTMLLPLATIGISMVTAQQVVSGLANVGLGISQETVVFMTAIMIGAGVDYAVFLISRYHEHLRRGLDSDQAVMRALTGIGKVIAASAATVAVTFLGMIFARMPLFPTVGPALALSISVAFLAAVTLLPAFMVLAGRRGWIAPKQDLTSRFWRRSGIHIVRRPVAHLVASLVILISLATCSTLMRFNYDDRKSLPASAESNLGFAAIDRHFPVSSMTPQYLLVQSTHDLRTPKALADLEQMARRVSQLPDIAMVRGITRPTGQPLEQATLSWQAGVVGDKLSDVANRIAGANGDLGALTSGARQLADSLGAVRSQVSQAIAVVSGLAKTLAGIENQVASSKTLHDIERLAANMRSAGNSMGANVGNLEDMLNMIGPVLAGLNASPVCAGDPACSNARDLLQRLVDNRNRGQLDTVADLARQLQSISGVQDLEATLQGIRASLGQAVQTIRALGLDNPGALQNEMATVQQGVNALANGSEQVADGVRVLADQTRQVGGGLSDAAALLLAVKLNAMQPSMAGFYIPPQVMADSRFKDLAGVFMSPDGHAVRYLVQSKLEPFETKAMDQVKSIANTARGAQPNTSLADASISMAGLTPTGSEMRDYYDHDLWFIVGMTIAVVFVILVLLLWAVVAPLYLVGTVILSYLSALGIGVIVFQFIGGRPLAWSVPALAFIILVAVGADYNMLLISRIRDESPYGIRSGVIRTVGTTGGVITSAGLIFAASMFGLLFASLSDMVQVGFVMGVGLLLDTFLVRTITVPALAVLAGKGNWWPSKWQPSKRRERAHIDRDASDLATVGAAAKKATAVHPSD